MLRLKHTNKKLVAQHTRNCSERTTTKKKSEWRNKMWITSKDKYVPLDGVLDLDQQGWSSVGLGADVSPFRHSFFGKLTHGCFSDGEQWKTKRASTVCCRGAGCTGCCTCTALSALSQPTLNLVLRPVEQNRFTQLLFFSLSHNFLFY